MFNEGERSSVNDERPTRHRRSSSVTLRRYRKGRNIRETLYGSVWQGEDRQTGQKVVIKSSNRTLAMNKTLRNGESSKEDIDEEIRLHRMLSVDPEPCPHIIQMLDVVYTDVDINVILEQAPGDLFSHVENSIRKLEADFDLACDENDHHQIQVKHWQEMLRLIKQIIEATAYLHSRRICHRDLSLENILLNSEGDAKIIDFGVAREYEADWLAEKGPIGKTVYQSPECYTNKHYDGRDNDVWGIGVILWLMLFGTAPWSEPHIDDRVFRMIWNEGLAGIERILTRWQLYDRLPPYCGDFFAKIFSPQKSRLTVQEALNHPYITGLVPDDEYIERRLPVQVAEIPDPKLERMAHLTRYNRVKVPKPWAKMDRKRRHQIVDQLAQLNENRNVIDQRVVEVISLEYALRLDDTRAIIHYIWALSEYPSGVSFLDEESDQKLYINDGFDGDKAEKVETKEELKLEDNVDCRDESPDIDVVDMSEQLHLDEGIEEDVRIDEMSGTEHGNVGQGLENEMLQID